jgi:integrase
MDIYDSSSAVIGYEDYLRKRGLKESTINVYIIVIKRFIKNGYDFENYSHYNKFLEDHTIKKRSNYFYDVLISFVKWYFPQEKKATRNLILDAIKMTKKVVKDPIKQTVLLTDEQQMHIIKNMSEHKHSLICWIQKECGVRAGDVIRLKKDRIKFSIYKSDNKTYLTLEMSFIKKGDKVSKIPIFNAHLIRYLKEYLMNVPGEEEYIFIDRSKVYKEHKNNEFKLYRYNYHEYWKDLRQTCINIGIDPSQFSTHDWRRNFADRIWVDVLKKSDVEALRRAMDHAHIDTTIRYLRQSGLQTQDVFKKKFDLGNI